MKQMNNSKYSPGANGDCKSRIESDKWCLTTKRRLSSSVYHQIKPNDSTEHTHFIPMLYESYDMTHIISNYIDENSIDVNLQLKQEIIARTAVLIFVKRVFNSYCRSTVALCQLN